MHRYIGFIFILKLHTMIYIFLLIVMYKVVKSKYIKVLGYIKWRANPSQLINTKKGIIESLFKSFFKKLSLNSSSQLMWASLHANAQSVVVVVSFFVVCGLLALTYIKAALSSKNDSLHLIHVIMLVYFSPDFSAILSARCLWNCSHSGPIPPFTEYINGVKVPCSTCMIRWLKFFFFSFSCFA